MSIILLYHRIGTLQSDPWRLAVSRQHFAEHLDVLAACGQLLSLSKFVELLSQDRLPDDSISITFDDGYSDNDLHARPLLEAAGAPATFFLIAGYVGLREEFWWDELESLLLGPEGLPDDLLLEVNGKRLGLPGADDPDGRFQDRWELEKAEKPAVSAEARHDLYRRLWNSLLPLGLDSRRSALKGIRERTGRLSCPRTTYEPMTSSVARQIAEHDLFEIGSHTLWHPMLSRLSEDGLIAEIEQSKRLLLDITGQQIAHFSYPFGEYSPTCLAHVRRAGYSSACTVTLGTARREHLYELPRLEVSDCDGEGLARALQPWLAREARALVEVIDSENRKLDAKTSGADSAPSQPRAVELPLPKLIHRVWCGVEPPPQEIVDQGHQWKEFHQDWDVRLWTNESLLSLGKNRIPFLDSSFEPRRALSSALLLYHYGGVAVDARLACIGSLDKAVPSAGAFMVWEIDRRPSLRIFGAGSVHPWIGDLIEALQRSGRETVLSETDEKQILMLTFNRHPEVLGLDANGILPERF